MNPARRDNSGSTVKANHRATNSRAGASQMKQRGAFVVKQRSQTPMLPW